jgi:hypothetical protein
MMAFMTLHECWLLHLSKLDYQLGAAKIIANCFSLSDEDVNFVRNVRVVEVNRETGNVVIGRAKLNVHTSQEP